MVQIILNPKNMETYIIIAAVLFVALVLLCIAEYGEWLTRN